jgi:hypothetical protein
MAEVKNYVRGDVEDNSAVDPGIPTQAYLGARPVRGGVCGAVSEATGGVCGKAIGGGCGGVTAGVNAGVIGVVNVAVCCEDSGWVICVVSGGAQMS